MADTEELIAAAGDPVTDEQGNIIGHVAKDIPQGIGRLSHDLFDAPGVNFASAKERLPFTSWFVRRTLNG